MDDPNRAVTVDLGDLAEMVEECVRSGEYESASEVVRAGLEALEREKREFKAVLKTKVEEAMADPRPSIPAAQVSRDMEDYHRQRMARDAAEV